MSEVAIVGLHALSPQNSKSFSHYKPPAVVTGLAKSYLPHLPSNRSLASEELSPSDLGLECMKETLSKAGLEVKHIDYVISCTQTPDFNNPGLVSLLLAKLECSGIPGLELKQLVCGPLFALDFAKNLISSGQAKRIGIVGCETFSRYFDQNMLNTESASDLSDEVLYAGSAFADAVSSFVVVSETDSIVSCAESVFSLVDISIGSSYSDSPELFCQLPSARQFPLRMSEQDVSEHRHLPLLDPRRFCSSATERLESLSESLSEQYNNSALHCHLPVSEIQCEGGQAFNAFESNGFCGAAGPWLSLFADEDSKHARVFSYSPGASWGMALLERKR